jgi:hypothetical protein
VQPVERANTAMGSERCFPSPQAGYRGRYSGRRTGEDCRHVLEQLEPAVECTAGDHLEGHVWVPVVDPLPPSAAGDDGEDHHPEAVDDVGLEQRPAQGEAADRA